MWHPVFKEEELIPGKILCTNIEDKKILVMRSEGKLYSCGAMCPHQGVSMADGWVFDDEITCPGAFLGILSPRWLINLARFRTANSYLSS